MRLGRVILRQGRWHADHTVTTCEGETLKPDLDSWAISHIERRQNHSSVEVSVAWLEAAGRIATFAGGEFRFLSLAAASENLLMEYRMAKPPFGKHALPVSHTHMTAAAMITAAIAAATAIAHFCAAWYASLRHRDIPFHALLI